MYIEKESAPRVITAMKDSKHWYHWYMRKHVASRLFDNKLRCNANGAGGDEQVGNSINRTTVRRVVSTELTQKPLAAMFCTYNIKGARYKQYGLRRMLERYSNGCLVLQETRTRATDWALTIQWYHCFSVYGERMASQRSVATAVRRGITAYTVGV